MGPLLNAQELVTRLKLLSVPGLVVASAGMRELRQTFGQVYPAVYILRQTAQARSSGGSSNPLYGPVIQTWDISIEIAVIAKKYVDSVVESDTARATLCAQVFDQLFGWAPPGAFTSLDCNAYADGDPADTANYGVQKWHCSITTRKTT